MPRHRCLIGDTMPTKRAAHLIYQGAVYREALEAPKPFKERYDEPAPEKPSMAPAVKERAKKWKQRYNVPKPQSKEFQQQLDEFLQRREENEPQVAPTRLAPESKKGPVDIALTFKKISPIWFGMHHLVKALEEKLNQKLKEDFESYSLQILRWFTDIAQKSTHADVRAVGRMLAQIPEDARMLFTYNPPKYNGMSKYFSREDNLLSTPAINKFITRVNEVAKDQGWNIHS